MSYKFQLNQRVKTPMGDGVIDTLPYNEISDAYIVYLDKPYNALGCRMQHEFVCEEKYIAAL